MFSTLKLTSSSGASPGSSCSSLPGADTARDSCQPSTSWQPSMVVDRTLRLEESIALRMMIYASNSRECKGTPLYFTSRVIITMSTEGKGRLMLSPSSSSRVGMRPLNLRSCQSRSLDQLSMSRNSTDSSANLPVQLRSSSIALVSALCPRA